MDWNQTQYYLWSMKPPTKFSALKKILFISSYSSKWEHHPAIYLTEDKKASTAVDRSVLCPHFSPRSRSRENQEGRNGGFCQKSFFVIGMQEPRLLLTRMVATTLANCFQKIRWIRPSLVDLRRPSVESNNGDEPDKNTTVDQGVGIRVIDAGWWWLNKSCQLRALEAAGMSTNLDAVLSRGDSVQFSPLTPL